MSIAVGVVGAGFMGETHVSSLRKVEDAKVSYVCDIDANKGKPMAESVGARYVSDFSELLSKKLDIIDICLPTPLHKEFAVRALEAGFHVFLEKPLALTLEQGEAICKAASKSSGLSMVGHVLRFWPGYLELRERIQRGEVGEPRHILAYRVGPPPGWAAWYMDMNKSNGVIFDLGIHDIDYVRWLMGEPKAVYSQVHEREGVHLHGQVLLDYGFGEALCECSWIGSATFPFTTYLEVAGTAGLAHVDSRAASAYAIFQANRSVRLDPYHEDGYARELRHFVECVKEGTDPMVPVSEALQTMKVSLAAVESAKGGKRISLG